MPPPEFAGCFIRRRYKRCCYLEQRRGMSRQRCWHDWRGFTSGRRIEWHVHTNLSKRPEVGSIPRWRACSRRRGFIRWSTTSRYVKTHSRRTSCISRFLMYAGGEREDGDPGPASFGGTNRWNWMEQGNRRRPNRISGEAKRFCCNSKR